MKGDFQPWRLIENSYRSELPPLLVLFLCEAGKFSLLAPVGKPGIYFIVTEQLGSEFSKLIYYGDPLLLATSKILPSQRESWDFNESPAPAEMKLFILARESHLSSS